MMTFKIAFRNIFRNRRRSLMTMSAIAVGGVAALIFGGYMVYTILGFQTITVQRAGHLTVFRDGYFNFGTGNPAAYGIAEYKELLALVRDDPVLKPLVVVATPTLSVFGIAGNFEADTSKTFFGVGVIPSERDRMRSWNGYGLGRPGRQSGLADDDPARGVIGTGVARILGLCERLDLSNCPPAPRNRTEVSEVAGAPALNLPVQDGVAATDGAPWLDLLAGTAGGAPNIVRLRVEGAEYQGFKEFDDNYVGLHLDLAQQLLYGRGAAKATGIVIQMLRTEDMGAARARLLSLFRERGLDLEVRDFTELTPLYGQVIGLYASIFSFISVIMGIVVLFTVVNTMGMSVVERTNEIGTVRAMGIRRRGIRRQFLVEGSLLGALGATAAVLLAALVAYALNNGGLVWTPPGATQPVPLRIFLFGNMALVVGVWAGLVLVSTIASLLPAMRAAKLPIVEALRHV